MLTAIPVHWLEDNGWRVETKLTASGKVLPAACRQIVLSRIAPLCGQDAGSTLTTSESAAALAGEKHSRKALPWACASHEPPFGVPALAGPDRLKAGLQTSGVSTDQFMFPMRALPAWRRAGGKSSRRAISDFGFRLSDFRLRRGWTLIETIAVLAVIAILAALVAPTIIKRVDRAAWTKETADLNAIGDALTQSILRTKTIPSHTTWTNAVASQMSLPVSAISINARRYARAFYIDQNLDINGSTLPYTQTTNGATKPVSARVMIVSSLSTALPSSLPSGLLSTSEFDPIWNAADGAKPSTWTTWTGTGDDLRIKKINLEPLFHQLIMFNHDTSTNPAPFSIDRAATNTVATGPPGWNKYYLENSDLWLLDSNYNVRTRYLMRRSISFVFESGSWRGQIQGGETFSDTGGQTASEFLRLASTFYSAPTTSSAQQAGASPSSVLVTMYTFMFDYVFWATECPRFSWHGFSTNVTPSQLPEYRMLNDVGQNSTVGTIDKYSSDLVK